MRPALSIVTTLYHSAAHVEEFCRRMTAAAERVAADHELILVCDGSPDQSLDIAVAIAARDPRVVVVELARNYGQHRAIMAGLRRARGELVFLIDCDLEEEPEWLDTFAAALKAGDSDVVYGVQRSRRGSWFERVTGDLFYWIFNLLSDYPIPANLVTTRLMRRPYVRALTTHRDREIFLAGLWAITGFRQVEVPVTKRRTKATTYGIGRRLRMLIDGITSFSRRPLVLVFYLGCVVIIAAVIGAAALTYYRLTSGFLPGWASVVVSVWLLGGLTLFSVGLVGIYLSRVFMETKRRPSVIVRRVYGRRADARAAARRQKVVDHPHA